MRGGSVTERLDSNQKKSPQKPVTESKFKRLNRRGEKEGRGGHRWDKPGLEDWDWWKKQRLSQTSWSGLCGEEEQTSNVRCLQGSKTQMYSAKVRQSHIYTINIRQHTSPRTRLREVQGFTPYNDTMLARPQDIQTSIWSSHIEHISR